MLDSTTKRTVKETVTMYQYEPTLKDIYVEGITDKLVMERFLHKNNVKKTKVKDISDINFDELPDEQKHIKENNKNKLIELARLLKEEYEDTLQYITCIIDKDFDEILQNIVINKNYLTYTDFNSLELYLFNEHTFEIFYKNILRTFPATPKKTVRELQKAVVNIFLIRLSININYDNKEKKFELTNLKKAVKINKKNNTIQFAHNEYLIKILNNNNLRGELQKYQSTINKYEKKCVKDIKNYIRGHDFITIFFFYVNKIKNNIGLTEETLERSLFQCIDFSELRKNNLFTYILEKYT